MLTLVFDGHYLLHRYLHLDNIATLESSTGCKTGGLFGVLRDLIKYVQRFKPNRVVFCWDSGRSSRRKIAFPGYKEDRKLSLTATDEEKQASEQYFNLFNESHRMCEVVLPFFGVCSLTMDKREADDICALISVVSPGNTVLVSDDSDYCFTGDTKISLLNGTEVPIKDLVGVPEFWVYSCTHEGKIVPGRGHSARKTKTVNEICVVTLDNGEEVKCTPDHRFMLRDGTYKEAKDLTEGESLMPLYRRLSTDGMTGYEEVLHNTGCGDWQRTHQNVVENILGGYRGVENKVAHHVDLNKRNNSPDNLVLMSWKDHISIHNENSEIGRQTLIRFNKSDKHRKDAAILGRLNKDKLTAKNRSTSGRRSSSRNMSAVLKKLWATADHKAKMRPIQVANGKISIEKTHAKQHNDPVYKERMRKILSDTAKRTMGMATVCPDCGKICGNVGVLGRHKKTCDFRNNVVVNHKIMSVKIIQDCKEVYDFTVDTYNNFALTSGVFVHNCQLISEKCSIYKPMKDLLIDVSNYTSETSFRNSFESVLSKAICGGHDNLPSIPGTSGGSVSTSFKEFGTEITERNLDLYFSFCASHSSVRIKRISEYVEQIIVNLEVSNISKECFSIDEIKWVLSTLSDSNIKYDQMAVLDILGKYELNSLDKYSKNWEPYFERLGK